MAIFVVLIGFLVNLVGGVMLLVLAFRKSVGWGLACLFIPFAGLVFVIQNWSEAKTAFLTSVGGAMLMLLGVVTMPRPTSTYEPQQQASASSPTEAAAVPQQPQAYEPPRSAYTPPAYTPPSTPAPQTVPVASTTTVEEEKPHTFEMVYIDRDTRLYYSEKCKKKPDGVARVAKSVAVMQGYQAAKCR